MTPIYKTAWFFALAALALLLLLGTIIFISYTRRRGTKYQGKSLVSLSKPVSAIQLQFYELELSVVRISNQGPVAHSTVNANHGFRSTETHPLYLIKTIFWLSK